MLQKPSKLTPGAARAFLSGGDAFARIRVARAIVFSVMAILAGLAVYLGLQLPRLDDALLQLERAGAVQRDLAQLSDDAADVETAGRGYLLTSDDEYLDPYRRGMADAADRLSRLREALAGDEESLRRLEVIAGTLRGKIDNVTRYVRLARDGDTAGAIAVVRGGNGKQLMDRFRAETAGLSARLSARQSQIEQDVASHERRVVLGVAVVLALSILLMILAWELGRRSAQALDEAGRESRTILDSLAEGVVKQASDGTVVAANRCAADILGLTSEQLMGRDAHDPRWSTILEDGTPCPGDEHPAMVALKSGRAVRGFVMGVSRPQGDRAWLLLNSLPVEQSAPGQPAAVVTSFLDITRLREEHLARIASETRVRALFDNVPDAIIVRDSEGRILEANRAAVDVWGYSRDELLRMNVADIGHDMTASDAFRVAEQASRGDAMSIARLHRRKDGRLIPTETSITAIVERGERRIMAVVRDISKQREFELALIRSEEQLRTIISHIPAPIGYFDGNGVCRFANLAMEAWCVGHPGLLTGQRISDLACFTSIEGSSQAYEAVRHGIVAHFEWAEADRGAVSRFATVSLIPDTAGELAGGFFCLVTDTTELTIKVRERSRELAEALDVTRAAVAAKDEFLANASHEMRTPLHAIRAFSDLAVKRQAAADAADDKLSRYLGNIQVAASRLSGFIEDILELVSLQSGRAPAPSETLDVRQHVQAVVAELDADLRARDMTLRVESRTTDAHVAADGKMLDRLLRSLLRNAITFSQPGTEVTVALEDGIVAGQAPEIAPSLRVTVSDQGPGIPESELEQIFEKFRQSTRTQTGAGGSGLGLTICRAIMQRHGGTIVARNLPGGGAAFDVDFPRTPSPVSPRGTPDPMPAPLQARG